ncbi:TatD family hydrolase [Methanothermococcus okinawensis]|uniref:TatD-related deoxyribonuclease n=1 Tax=Methanothermococcus okinawensis (strain DSM 14208 / JCM 11175 / IH1) TaxID=647113 RepID=F8ALQ7_METOI|nr:TatD family hydrolase [Methanothermococcus okinawensis]AEH06608.1 TatD-related deoxyribonuclease [Methanothermococcus okinawensis IH1]
MIDAHTHLDVRSFEDLEKMALCGIETIITCAHDPYKMSVPEVCLDHWDRLVKLETKRGKMAGVNVKVAVGAHPMGYPKHWDELLKKLPDYFENENVVAIGETGLHYLTDDEKNLLKEQLYLAKDYNMPIIIHTPEKNKKEALLEILKILDDVKIKDDLVMIDHINKDTVDIIDKDVYIGLTVQPSMKISHIEASEIIKNYNKKFILSSDLGSLKADIYALPRTKLYMKKIGVEEDKIVSSTYKNAKKFYRLL